MVAARLGMGSLGFAFETPEELEERVEQYYELVREECYPIGEGDQPRAGGPLRPVLLRHGRRGDREGAGGRAVLRLLARLLLQPVHRRQPQARPDEHLPQVHRLAARAALGPVRRRLPRLRRLPGASSPRSRRTKSPALSGAPPSAAAASAPRTSSRTRCASTRPRTWT